MKKIIVFICFCFVAFDMYCQIKNFDLSQYKLPDLKRQTLDLNFDMGGSSSNIKTSFNNDNYDANSNEDNNFSLTNKGSIKWNLYVNNNNYQGDQTIEINYNQEYRKKVFKVAGFDGSDVKYNIMELQTSILSNNRFYNGNNFFEIDFFADISGAKNDNTSDHDIKYKLFKSNTSIPIKFGFGRIERVEDARLALYILDDLSKNNKLSHEPNNDEILKFATVISQIQNERFFDTREKKMFEIQKVDSFLRASNLLKDSTINTFLIINDNWDYSNGPVRESGSRLAFGIRPTYYTYASKNEGTTYLGVSDKTLFTSVRGDLFAEYIYEKPIDLYWQYSFSFTTGIGIGKSYDKQYDVTNNEDIKSYFLALQAGIGYYPNSRTYLNASLFGSNTYNDEKGDEDVKDNNYSAGFYIDCYYYIAPQFRLKIYDELSYSDTVSKYSLRESTDYKLNNNFSVSLLYSFF